MKLKWRLFSGVGEDIEWERIIEIIKRWLFIFSCVCVGWLLDENWSSLR